MWSSSPFHTRGGAPACSTPPPTTRTATATATATTTNRICNARLTSVPGLRSVVPHIDEMLHQFCRALSAILRCSSPLPPILILGAWRRSLGAPPRARDRMLHHRAVSMNPGPQPILRLGEGGGSEQPLQHRLVFLTTPGGAIFCRCAVWGSVVLTFPYYAQRLGGIWGLTAAVCTLGNLEYMKSDMQAIGQWLVCTSLLCKQSLSLPQTRPPTRQPTRHPTMQCRKAELQGIHFVRALCVGAPGA